MPEQFKVDLRGLVEILGHHLYTSERVYLRELVQNARDAIKARERLEDDLSGAIEIVPARGYEQLVVRDNGVGLTEDEMRALLSIIGSTSKRGGFATARSDFLGQFGIGLLSCFLVTDAIEVTSRSARTREAPTLRWVGHSDGTFTIDAATEPLSQPGTEVRLRPRHGFHRWCDLEACTSSATAFAEFLDVPLSIVNGEDEVKVSQQTPPWKLSTEEQLAWCRMHFGFEALGIVEFNPASANVVGVAFVLPYPAQPGYRTGDRIYSKGMLVADTDDLVVPRWAFFCRAVIDAGDLPLTASREGLQEGPALQFVRQQIGFRLLTELIVLQGRHPAVYRSIVALHADGLKALAVDEPAVRDLLRTTLPYETTQGERTIQQLIDQPGPVPYLADIDVYRALSDVAAHAGLLVVNASGKHEADLLQVIDHDVPGTFCPVGAREIAELAQPTSNSTADIAQALCAKAQTTLSDEPTTVVVSGFEPVERPVLWWPTEQHPDSASTSTPDQLTATLALNSANPVVKTLLDTPVEDDLGPPLQALYVIGLLLGRQHPTPTHVAQLTSAVLDMATEWLANKTGLPKESNSSM